MWSTNFNPEELTYEAYFTAPRLASHDIYAAQVMRSGRDADKNLGSDEQGLWSVSSTASGSSEPRLRA